MDIIIGHSNMDLDCIASIVLARKLYPGHVPVRSSSVHPMARPLLNMYETELDLVRPGELEGKPVDSIVLVDTRSRARVKEFLQHVQNGGSGGLPPVTIYDHHPKENNDFPDAEIIGGNYGSTATILGELLMRRDVMLSPAEATISLAGIFSDTGNFTHQNVSAVDFHVASWLLDRGASLQIVSSMIKSMHVDQHIGVFHDALNRIVYRTVKDHLIGYFLLRLEENVSGLSTVVERLFEVEDADALFGIFEIASQKSVLLVARSKETRIPLNRIMAEFGGGGHTLASSATVKKADADEVRKKLQSALDRWITPAVTARDIMSEDVLSIHPDSSLVDASMFLERIDHTGAPVLDNSGALVGFLTLRDIMKGRRSNMMKAPVKGYMTRRVYTCKPDSTIRELEQLFFSHNVGHLPVMVGKRIVGIVTRTDYLRFLSERGATGA